jgi:hypothetical protein
MSSECKPNPAGENSRREFFQKIGALAAASSLVATANAAPLPAEPMPMVRFGQHMISRLIIGCNTVGGLSHLSAMIDVEMKAWNTHQQLVADFKHALELGINCVEAPPLALVNDVNKLGVGKMMFTARGSGEEDPKTLAKEGCIAIHHPGYSTDILWRMGQLYKVREYCKKIRDAGVLVAITSHRPEVFKEIESQDWDVDYYMPCVYKYGRTHAEWERSFAANPGMAPAELYHSNEETSQYYGGETAFVRGDPAEMYQVIKQTKRPCFAYKILASGRLCEKPEFVEATFREAFANIKPTDAVVVGHWTKQMDQYAINAGYVRKYGSNTVTTTSAL